MSDKIKSIKISGVERNIEDITTREMLEQEIERANNDSTQIKGRVSTVEARSIDSQTKLNTLQGSGEGSIRKSIQDAIDALPNTYYNKGEVVDLVDEHKPYIWSGNTSTAIFNEIKKAAEYGSNIILNYKNLSVTSVSDSTITGFIDNGTTLTNYTITKDNVSTTITNIDPTSKQDVIPDLSTIRQGATLGATALQEIPEDYKKVYIFGNFTHSQGTILSVEEIEKIGNAINNNFIFYWARTWAIGITNLIPLSYCVLEDAKGVIRYQFSGFEYYSSTDDHGDFLVYRDIIINTSTRAVEKLDTVNALGNVGKGSVTKVQINGYDKTPDANGVVNLGYGILDKVKMNGTEYTGGSTSTVDLGTVITELKLNSAALAPTSGSISIPNASTSTYGATKLSSATNSTSTSLAATPKAVKDAYDLANGKQDKLTSGTNIKTINNTSLLGSGNISITHPDDGAGAAGSYAATNPTSLVGATKITIPTITVNTRGHVSAAGINEVSVPDFTKYATSITCDDMVAGVVGNTVDISTFFNGLQTRLVSGTNIKTINGKSILGKGNIDTGIEYLTLLASSFGNSDGSASIYPGKYYKVIEDVNDIRFKLEPPTSNNILNEYLVEFKCVGSVTLPDTLLWPESGVPEFVPGNTYQLSIVNDLAVCVCFVDDLNIGTLSFNGSIWRLVFEKPVASALDIRWSYEDMYNPGNYVYDEFFGSISSGGTTASGGIGANRPISVTITPSSDSTWRYGVNIISNHSEEL